MQILIKFSSLGCKCMVAKCMVAKCMMAKCMMAKCMMGTQMEIEWLFRACNSDRTDRKGLFDLYVVSLFNALTARKTQITHCAFFDGSQLMEPTNDPKRKRHANDQQVPHPPTPI